MVVNVMNFMVNETKQIEWIAFKTFNSHEEATFKPCASVKKIKVRKIKWSITNLLPCNYYGNHLTICQSGYDFRPMSHDWLPLNNTDLPDVSFCVVLFYFLKAREFQSPKNGTDKLSVLKLFWVLAITFWWKTLDKK